MSTIRRRFKITTESLGFGSLNASTGNPDTSSYTFTAMEGNGAYEHFGDPKVSRIAGDRDGIGKRPLEPDSWVESGEYKEHFTGELTWVHHPRGVGATPTLQADGRPLDLMLRSGLGVIAVPAGGPSDAVDTAGTSTSYTGTNGAAYPVGGLVRYDGVPANGVQAAQVLSADAATHVVHYSPSFLDQAFTALTLQSSDVVRAMRTYYAGDEMVLGSPLAIEIHSKSSKQIATGGRLRQLIIEDGVEKRLQMTTNIVFAHSSYDHANADVSGTVARAAGKRIRRVRSKTVIAGPVGVAGQAASGISVGAGIESSRIKVKSWKLTITHNLVPVEDDNVLGMSEMEILDTDITLELETVRPDTAVDDDLFGEKERAWMQTWGPLGNGEGAALYLPAAHETEGSQAKRRDLPEGAPESQKFTLEAGVPRQLAEPAGAAHLARAAVFFGLGV